MQHALTHGPNTFHGIQLPLTMQANVTVGHSAQLPMNQQRIRTIIDTPWSTEHNASVSTTDYVQTNWWKSTGRGEGFMPIYRVAH